MFISELCLCSGQENVIELHIWAFHLIYIVYEYYNENIEYKSSKLKYRVMFFLLL